jgi:hypothetical protein
MIGVRIRDTKKLPQKPNLRDFPRYPIKAEMKTSGRIARMAVSMEIGG